ncbi:hypothetical protein EDD15DRAFT_2106988, partial [Pisolithus albus]
ELTWKLQVFVRLKWGLEYKGFPCVLADPSFWSFQCVAQLANTEQFQDSQSTGTLGEVFICCNNILYI